MCVWRTLWLMQLSTYLSENAISDHSFAALIGVDRSSVHRIRNRKQTPSADLMRVIAEKTSGAVTPNDFFGVAVQAAA